MRTDFVLQVKCTIFWLNRGLMVYLDLYAPDFPKSTGSTFYILVLFSLKQTILEVFLVKTHPNHEEKKRLATQKYENLVKNTFNK